MDDELTALGRGDHVVMARGDTVFQAGDEVLALGRSVRFATDAQWRALVVRDECCRWAGCRMPAETDPHRCTLIAWPTSPRWLPGLAASMPSIRHS